MNPICLLIGHDYVLIQKLTVNHQRIGCPRCKRTWVKDDLIKSLFPWEAEYDEMHETLHIKLKCLPWEGVILRA